MDNLLKALAPDNPRATHTGSAPLPPPIITQDTSIPPPGYPGHLQAHTWRPQSTVPTDNNNQPTKKAKKKKRRPRKQATPKNTQSAQPTPPVPAPRTKRVKQSVAHTGNGSNSEKEPHLGADSNSVKPTDSNEPQSGNKSDGNHFLYKDNNPQPTT